MKFEYILVADEAQIIDIFVEPEQRRQGLAEKKLRDWITSLSAGTKIILEVRTGNIPALKLYEKLGFTQLYVRKNYYTNPTEDASVMQLLR